VNVKSRLWSSAFLPEKTKNQEEPQSTIRSDDDTSSSDANDNHLSETND
jgi:hypothetical protein